MNGDSEGPTKDFFLIQSIMHRSMEYHQGWDVPLFPPLNSSGYEIAHPNYPENDPAREARKSSPYPDTAVPGLTLNSAMAPLYYAGEQYNYTFK